MKTNQLARGLLWGRLLASLEAASKAMAPAYNTSHGLVSEEIEKEIKTAQEAITGLEMVCWAAFDKEKKGKKR